MFRAYVGYYNHNSLGLHLATEESVSKFAHSLGPDSWMLDGFERRSIGLTELFDGRIQFIQLSASAINKRDESYQQR